MKKVHSTSHDLRTAAKVTAIVVGLVVQTYLVACWWLYPKLALVTFVKLPYTFAGEAEYLWLSLALQIENVAFVVACLELLFTYIVRRRGYASLRIFAQTWARKLDY